MTYVVQSCITLLRLGRRKDYKWPFRPSEEECDTVSDARSSDLDNPSLVMGPTDEAMLMAKAETSFNKF